MRKISFETACARYPMRYTMEHKPEWAKLPCPGKTAPAFYAPQYATDREWYERTKFPGERGYPFGERETQCYSTGQTWPRGQWLEEEFKK
jgi:hypothetical protein